MSVAFNTSTKAEREISRVAGSAERAHPGWVREAAEALGWAAEQAMGPHFTVEELRMFIAAHAVGWLAEPPDRRAWGAATQLATRLGYITRTGDYAPAVSSNGSPKPLYRAGQR